MATLKPWSDETENLLSSMPPEGDTHRWFARVASRLAHVMPKEYTMQVLQQCANMVTHRSIPDRELNDALAFGYGEVAVGKGKKYTWPEPQPTLIGEVLADSEPICNPANSTGLRPTEVMGYLYNPAHILCLSMDQFNYDAMVWPDDFMDANEVAKYQFIVPNPLKAKVGVNNAGEESVRCQNNIEARRFVVVEFDKEPDKLNQARLLAFLSESIPCVMVVDSAGKSLHGWFPVYNLTESHAAAFFGKAVALGADSTIYDTCKLVRMPGGIRDGKFRQRIVYWDEEALP